MALTTRDMFVYEIGQTRNLERMGDRMLSEMADQIQDPELPGLLHDEEEARHRQAANFDACLAALGAAPIEINAPTVEALRERFYSFARLEPAPEALDIFALGTALRLVHAVIAGYKELVGLAGVLGEHECQERMQDNLAHKQRYADRLERRGQAVIKRLVIRPETATMR